MREALIHVLLAEEKQCRCQMRVVHSVKCWAYKNGWLTQAGKGAEPRHLISISHARSDAYCQGLAHFVEDGVGTKISVVHRAHLGVLAVNTVGFCASYPLRQRYILCLDV